LNEFTASAGPDRSTQKMAIPFSSPRDSQGSIMFKRRAAGQRIFPSEMTAHSMAPAPAPMTTSDSISADLHHVGDEERKGYVNGEQPPGFRAGLYVPAIKLAAINPPVWLVSTPENRIMDESEPWHRAAGTPSCFMN
jgi:hypothetical protein